MGLEEKHCRPCEGGVEPLSIDEENSLQKQVSGWTVDRALVHKLRKRYSLGSFRKAVLFVNRVARIAEEEKHHPDIHISYTTVSIDLWTHAIVGLSENDFILAAKIDGLESVPDGPGATVSDWSI